MSTGGMFSPPAVIMSSLMRPVMCMKPLQSKNKHTHTQKITQGEH